MKTLTIAIALAIAIPAAARDLENVSACVAGVLSYHPQVESFSMEKTALPRIFTVRFREDSKQPREAKITLTEWPLDTTIVRYAFEITPPLVETGPPIRWLRFRINNSCLLGTFQPFPMKPALDGPPPLPAPAEGK
jgi:hypothetical protein